MKDIAKAPHYFWPEPILVIIGGSPPEQCTVKAYVFPKGERPIALVNDNETASAPSKLQSVTVLERSPKVPFKTLHPLHRIETKTISNAEWRMMLLTCL
jgi:hypothetical protein